MAGDISTAADGKRNEPLTGLPSDTIELETGRSEGGKSMTVDLNSVDAVQRQRTHLGFLPIPRRCRFDPSVPFAFTLPLNIWFAFCSTLTVANLYYPQPINLDLAERFSVSYEESSRILSLTQGGYLTALVLILPLLDLLPRRPLLLGVIFLGATFSIGLATTSSFLGFQILSYITGVFTVTPQILNPLVADLAPAHRRSQAVSINVSGLVLGMAVGRLLAGIVTKFTGDTRNVYWVAAGMQYIIFIGMWWLLPNYPKKQTGLTYLGLLKSTMTIFCSQPVLIQACFIGWASCSIFVSWWTTLTFLLSDAPYHYSEFRISLFAIAGLGAVAAAPIVGRMADRILPNIVTFIGLFIGLLSACVALGAAKHLAAVILICIFTDISQQSQQLGNQSRIFSLDPTARSRINSAYTCFVFLGQVTGSSVGSRLYLQHGWRACYAFSIALSVFAIGVLLVRGPNAKGWLGWSGDYSLRRRTPKREAEDEETVVEPIETEKKP